MRRDAQGAGASHSGASLTGIQGQVASDAEPNASNVPTLSIGSKPKPMTMQVEAMRQEAVVKDTEEEAAPDADSSSVSLFSLRPSP